MNTSAAGAGTIPALTGVRAFAAIWVMLLHFPFSVGVQPFIHLHAPFDHGAWGVDIFFVLSGFILSLLYVERFQSRGLAAVYRDYLAARLARIYPLHLAALAAVAVLEFARAVAHHAHSLPPGANLYHLVLNLLLLHAWGYAEGLSWNYPSWSISCEWFAYLLLTPVLTFGLRRVTASGCLLLAAALWAGLCIAVEHMGARIAELATSWAVPRIIAEFTLGYALYRVYAKLRWQPRTGDLLTLGGAAAILLLSFMPPAAEVLLAPAVSLLILGLARTGPVGRWLFANRWAVFWGERSYSIYMLHAVVQIYIGHLLLSLHLVPTHAAQGWALLALMCLLVLGAAHLAYLYIELPMRERLRDALSRTRTTAVTAAG